MAFVNEGAWDRVIRIVAGALLLYGAWIMWPGTAGVVFAVVGAIALITGIVGWCPVYALFHVSTKKRLAS
jgi:hypothetical protein